MTRLSNGLKGYSGANPFTESQARTFADLKLVREFYPTSTFLSLINEQHEVLLGTRGSGKTCLLRMLRYSGFQSIQDPRLTPLQQARSFIGFYMPLRLEFLSRRPLREAPNESVDYFQFAANCVATMSLLREVQALINDLESEPTSRLLVENRITTLLVPYWLGTNYDKSQVASFDDLRRHVNILYRTIAPWRDGDSSSAELPLAAPLLTPVATVLPEIAQVLRLDAEQTQWIACIDEAEFLSEPYIRCINTFMRSDKRPLVLKIATLPTKHSTHETLIPGVSVQPDGHDFSYRRVDMHWDSDDFSGFTDHLTRVRLGRCAIEAETLEAFLGDESDGSGLDHYRREFGEDANEAQILKDILACLSEARRLRFERIEENREHVRQQYLKKFRPVYYVRRMAAEDRTANRNVGWFAGARTVRQISDGNPRRFIQVMNCLFDCATRTELDEKAQHRELKAFALRHAETMQGLPEQGPLLAGLMSHIGKLLARRIHGPVMTDGGSGFFISDALLDDPTIRAAIDLGIDYAEIVPSEVGHGPIRSNSALRLAYVLAARYWLPMREGVRPRVATVPVPKQLAMFNDKLTRSVVQQIVENLQLILQEESDDDDDEA